MYRETHIGQAPQLVPQIILNYRRHHSEGLHAGMMLLWAAAGVPLTVHNVLNHEHVALQVQAVILTSLSLVTYAQVLHYTHRWPLRRILLLLVSLIISLTLIEAAIICGFTYISASGKAPPQFVRAMAILSAVGLAAGVLRHYWDIYTEKTIRGISWLFVFFDAIGDLTSLLAVGECADARGKFKSDDSPAIRNHINLYAICIYAVELALWMGMVIIALAFVLAQRLKKREISVDENAALGPEPSSSAFSHVRSSAACSTIALQRRVPTIAP